MKIHAVQQNNCIENGNDGMKKCNVVISYGNMIRSGSRVIKPYMS